MKATINIFTVQTADDSYISTCPQVFAENTYGKTEEEAIQKYLQQIGDVFLNQRNECIEWHNKEGMPYSVTSVPIVFDMENKTYTFSESALDITRKMSLLTDLSNGESIESLLQKVTRPCEIQFLDNIKGANLVSMAYELGQQMYKSLHK
jgi:hypothetical protein